MRLNEQLLQKEMTRKDFLRYMVGIFIAVFGFSNFVSVLSSLRDSPDGQSKPIFNDDRLHGFGSRKFGK